MIPSTMGRVTVRRSPQPKYGSHIGGNAWKNARSGSKPSAVHRAAASAAGAAVATPARSARRVTSDDDVFDDGFCWLASVVVSPPLARVVVVVARCEDARRLDDDDDDDDATAVETELAHRVACVDIVVGASACGARVSPCRIIVKYWVFSQPAATCKNFICISWQTEVRAEPHHPAGRRARAMRAAAPSATATPRIATASRRDATRRDGFRPSRARHRRWTTRNNDDVRRRAARGHHDDRDLDFDPYADDGRAGPPPSRAAASHGRHQSSWTATETSQDVKGVDYLVELGKQSSNTNTEVGARKGIIDDVFAGTANAKFNLGADSDIASGRLRYRDVEHVRSFKNLFGDFHVPPLFVDKVSLHVAKNLMADSDNPGASANPLGGLTKVPLILGVWGAKGCGKTFNLELACKALDITPVVMSAGELEDEWAGNPGRLIRSRYVLYTGPHTTASAW